MYDDEPEPLESSNDHKQHKTERCGCAYIEDDRDLGNPIMMIKCCDDHRS